MGKKLFISYRREDSASAAGRLYDRLCYLLSPPNVFFDVSTIRGGEEFGLKIVEEIRRSDAILMVIGKNWLGAREDRNLRIREPNDYVRFEIRNALEQDRLVIPVLVDGAEMPAVDALPDDIRAIVSRNALVLRHASFDDDVETIYATIMGTPKKSRSWDGKVSIARKVTYIAGGSAAALALLTAAAAVHFLIWRRPLATSLTDIGTTALLVVTSIVGAWTGLRYFIRKRSMSGR